MSAPSAWNCCPSITAAASGGRTRHTSKSSTSSQGPAVAAIWRRCAYCDDIVAPCRQDPNVLMARLPGKAGHLLLQPLRGDSAFVHLSVLLAGPEPSGSADSSRRCRAAPSFNGLLRQAAGGCRGAKVCAPPREKVTISDPAPMIELLRLLLAAFIDALRSRQRLLPETSSSASSSRLPSVTNAVLASEPETSSSGFSSTASTGTGDATSSWSGPRPCCAGIARAGALSGAGVPAALEARGPDADRHYGVPERALGHRAHPRRAAQARHRRQRPLHPPPPAVWARSRGSISKASAHLSRRPERTPSRSGS